MKCLYRLFAKTYKEHHEVPSSCKKMKKKMNSTEIAYKKIK